MSSPVDSVVPVAQEPQSNGSEGVETETKDIPAAAEPMALDEVFDPLPIIQRKPKKVPKLEIRLSCILSPSGTPSSKPVEESAEQESEAAAVVSPVAAPEDSPPALDDDDTTFLDNFFAEDDDNVSNLDFFQETHEDQDPELQELLRRDKLEETQRLLKELEQQDLTGRQEISKLVNSQVREKQAAAEQNFNKYRKRYADERQQQMTRLQGLYRQKTSSNEQKINEGLRILQRRHQSSLQTAHQQHRRDAQSRRLPEQMANAEWQSAQQQIQVKQQQQLQEFRNRGEEMKRKTDNDLKREQDKIRKSYEQKNTELEASRQKLMAKLMAHFQQLKQRYVRRHMQKIVEKREELQSAAKKDTNEAFTPQELAKGTMDDKAELRPPSPLKATPSWSKGHVSGASLRHKHRKGILGQTTRQLNIEIHNEGLWISRSTGKQDEKDDQQLMPWGAKSYAILESVICGDVPAGFERYDYGEALVHQGGQMRCSVIDLRTSDQTASTHRASAGQEFEETKLLEMEKKVTELAKAASDAEKATAACAQVRSRSS